MEVALEISNLSVYYDKLCALSDINLKVYEKDFLAIIGPNGGGKSTLLKSVLGLLKPATGEIKVFGQSISRVKSTIGYVPQHTKFDKSFPISVEDVVLMGRLNAKFGFYQRFTKEDREIADSTMEELNIYDLRKRQIGQLSGGQMQRVLIARALSANPKILLLDEPTASVDANSSVQIYETLKKLNKEITIILVTHDLGFVSSYAANIACLNKKLLYHGKPLLNNEIFQQVYGCPVELPLQGVSQKVFHANEEGKDA